MELDAQNLKKLIACAFDLVLKRMYVVVDQTDYPSVVAFAHQYIL